MIGIVDYGLGNISAFLNIYSRLNIPAKRIRTPDDFYDATHLILPGVGSFDWAMHSLEASGLLVPLINSVHSKSCPLLGICVGMQMLASKSDEGVKSGLGWIEGTVSRLPAKYLSNRLALPHMGWNDVNVIPHPLFDNILDPKFYFLHSYFFEPLSNESILAQAEYGHYFPAAVFKDNVFGVQFHPEKSHHWGVKLLGNFAKF